MADKAIDTSNYVFLCMTANYWGNAKSQEQAIRNCREAGGSERLKKYGYVVYRVHPDFEIEGVNGTVMTPIGHPAIKVLDRIVKKKTA